MCSLSFIDKEKKKSIILEAICDSDTFIWYHFFGEPGLLNDIKILDWSLIVANNIAQTFDTSVTPYMLNEKRRDYLYFLVDRKYPQWSIITKTNPEPITESKKIYKQRHKHVRKDTIFSAHLRHLILDIGIKIALPISIINAGIIGKI